MSSLEKFTHQIKVALSPDGGSIGKYFTVGDFEIKEEQIKGGKEKSS
ncbi:hypothetical protein Pint_24425 [Pistacia integerrima]|uniref:Uncharacterized protein n=1 Tax=Pistacia integerrima TaxID=434235 RepID=A0ACC0YDH5_9ROSI|nr:hypothetical protein Pint_24425 [Pistacia integerrima]